MKLGRLMRKLAGLSICAVMLAAPAAANNIVGDVAVIRTLDKVTATTQDFNVKIGDTLKFGSLDITVKHCEKKPPEETPETYVFIQIEDRRTDSKGEDIEKEKLFSGWMFGSSPALSSLEHPVYDVWLIACKEPTGLRGSR